MTIVSLQTNVRRGQDSLKAAQAFADDTLLLGIDTKHLEEFLDSVAAANDKYGLSFHFWEAPLTWN